MVEYWGYHLTLNVKACDIIKANDSKYIKSFVKQLVKDIDMTAFGPCQTQHFSEKEFKEFEAGKGGWSVFQYLVTSNITAHFIDESGDCYFDVFSCKEFDPSIVVALFEKWFAPEFIDYAMIKRNTKVTLWKKLKHFLKNL